MSYEGFTGQDTGADSTVKLADFLRKAENGLDVVEAEQVPCVWEKVVNYRKASNPVMEASNPVMEASNPVMEASNPVMEANNAVMEASNPVMEVVNVAGYGTYDHDEAQQQLRRRLQAAPISYDRTQLRNDGIATNIDP
eukprot:11203842-Ditylum_brightwellii.AAC.1